MLTITLLGTAATMPLPERALTAAVAECGGHSLLLDCGEGTSSRPNTVWLSSGAHPRVRGDVLEVGPRRHRQLGLTPACAGTSGCRR